MATVRVATTDLYPELCTFAGRRVETRVFVKGPIMQVRLGDLPGEDDPEHPTSVNVEIFYDDENDVLQLRIVRYKGDEMEGTYVVDRARIHITPEQWPAEIEREFHSQPAELEKKSHE